MKIVREIRTMTIEKLLLLLFFTQAVVSSLQFITSLPLIWIFDLILILLGLEFVFNDPLNSLIELFKRHKDHFIKINSLCFLIFCLYFGFEFLRTTLLIVLVIPKLAVGSDNKQAIPTQTKEDNPFNVSKFVSSGHTSNTPELSPRRKRLMSETLNND